MLGLELLRKAASELGEFGRVNARRRRGVHLHLGLGLRVGERLLVGLLVARCLGCAFSAGGMGAVSDEGRGVCAERFLEAGGREGRGTPGDAWELCLCAARPFRRESGSVEGIRQLGAHGGRLWPGTRI